MQKISIVTVTYNCEACVEDTIKSVLSLNYPNVEYIVIDGQSKDNTMSIIRKYESSITHLVSERDKGIYDAMNKGLNLASGEWIFFLNAGDNFHDSDVLSKMPFQKVGDDSNICGIIGDVLLKKQGKIVEWNNKCKPFYENSKRLKNMGFSHQGVFVRTKLAREVGFDLSFKLCADYNMMNTLYNKGYRFVETDTIIAEVEADYGASLSNQFLQLREEGRICQCDKTLYFNCIYYWRKAKTTIKNFLKS